MGKPVRNRQPPDTGGIYLHPVEPKTAMAEMCVNFKRTLHSAHPLPHNKHSHRYPHHYQYPAPTTATQAGCTTRVGRLLSSSYLSKFLILLFLSICDNRACRTLPTLAEAATVVSSSSTSSSSTTVPMLATPGSTSSSSSSISISSSSTPSSSQTEVSSDSESSGAAVTFNRTKLQEIVMEGLGLSDIPDVRAVSKLKILIATRR